MPIANRDSLIREPTKNHPSLRQVHTEKTAQKSIPRPITPTPNGLHDAFIGSASNPTFEERKRSVLLNNFAVELAATFQKTLRKKHAALTENGESAKIRYFSFNTLLSELSNWSEGKELRDCPLLAATFQEIDSDPRAEHQKNIQAREHLKQVLQGNEQLLICLGSAVDNQKELNELLTTQPDEEDVANLKEDLANDNQKLAHIFYQALRSEKHSPQRQITSAITKLALELNKANLTDAEFYTGSLNGARAHAGVMFSLEKAGYHTLFPNQNQLLQWETNGVDFAAKIGIESMFILNRTLYLIDVKGRSKTADLLRQQRGELSIRATIDIYEAEPNEAHAEIGQQIRKRLQRSGELTTTATIKVRVLTIVIPTDETLLGLSGELAEAVEKDLHAKLQAETTRPLVHRH